MTAAYLDESYNSRLKTSTNQHKIKKIKDCYYELSSISSPGEYEVEWIVRDGIIQEIITIDTRNDYWSLQKSGEPNLAKEIDTLLGETLVLGWFGAVKITWRIDDRGTISYCVSKKRKFQ